MTNDIILKLNDLHYSYEDGTKALQGTSFCVSRGEKLAVMGANGAGKSTLFLTLNGVLKPQKGEIFLDGVKIGYKKEELISLRRRVGIVFQEPDNQLFCADVIGDISFGLCNMGLEKDEILKRVNAVIEEFEITKFAQKPVHFLSGGQKKLVSVAGVLVMEPDIIILDEPSGALDPKHTRAIDDVIDRLSERGITVILSTHNVDRAFAWADRIMLMDDGRVLKEGTPIEVFSDLTAVKQANLKQPAVMKVFKRLLEKGIVKQGTQMPKTTDELIEIIL